MHAALHCPSAMLVSWEGAAGIPNSTPPARHHCGPHACMHMHALTTARDLALMH